MIEPRPELDAARARLAERFRTPRADRGVPPEWRLWLRDLFGPHLRDKRGHDVPFAPHQERFWEWVWAIEAGERPRPFVAIWPRGGAKSTSAELSCVAVAAKRTRRYGLYICSSQDRADDHVQSVAGMFESNVLAARYPHVSERLVGKYGNSKGWRRNRIRTSVFTLDGIGLDVAARGAKLDEDRPDFIIIDDVDEEGDTLEAVRKKEALLTKTLLPAGAEDAAILFVQNVIHENSIAARLCGVDTEHKPDYLVDRIVTGPIPALRDLAYEERDGRWVLIAGQPTWAGQDLERCQEAVDTWGLTAFLTERQHDVTVRKGGMYERVAFRHCRPDEVPDLLRIVGWVDPAVTDKDESDSQGIQFDGVDQQGAIYRLWSWERRASPELVLRLAIAKGIDLKAQRIGVETDQGGDTWRPAYRDAATAVRDALLADQAPELPQRGLQNYSPTEVELYALLGALWVSLRERARRTGVPIDLRLPGFADGKAGAGHGSKVHRQSLQLAEYEKPGRIVHVLGTHERLEKALRRFPRKPLDLADASWWGLADLRHWIEEDDVPPMPAVLLPVAAAGGWSSTGMVRTARRR